jgi:hypothetical protein
MSREQAHLFFQIVIRRHERLSLIIWASIVPPDEAPTMVYPPVVPYPGAPTMLVPHFESGLWYAPWTTHATKSDALQSNIICSPGAADGRERRD